MGKIGKMRIRLFLAALILGWQLHGFVPETAGKIVFFNASSRSGPIFSQAKFANYHERLPSLKPGISPEDRH